MSQKADVIDNASACAILQLAKVNYWDVTR